MRPIAKVADWVKTYGIDSAAWCASETLGGGGVRSAQMTKADSNVIE